MSITYKFKWEISGSYFIGGSLSPRQKKQIEFFHKCAICYRDIPPENTVLIIEANSFEQSQTKRLCAECAQAIHIEYKTCFAID